MAHNPIILVSHHHQQQYSRVHTAMPRHQLIDFKCETVQRRRSEGK